MTTSKYLNVIEIVTKKMDPQSSLLGAIFNDNSQDVPTVGELLNEMVEARYNAIQVSSIESYNFKYTYNKYYIVEIKTFNNKLLCLTDADREDDILERITNGGYLYSSNLDINTILKEAVHEVLFDTMRFMRTDLPRILRELTTLRNAIKEATLLDGSLEPFRFTALLHLNVILSTCKNNLDEDYVTEDIEQLIDHIDYVQKSYETFKLKLPMDLDGDSDAFNDALLDVLSVLE